MFPFAKIWLFGTQSTYFLQKFLASCYFIKWVNKEAEIYKGPPNFPNVVYMLPFAKTWLFGTHSTNFCKKWLNKEAKISVSLFNLPFFKVTAVQEFLQKIGTLGHK